MALLVVVGIVLMALTTLMVQVNGQSCAEFEGNQLHTYKICGQNKKLLYLYIYIFIYIFDTNGKTHLWVNRLQFAGLSVCRLS